MRWIMLTRKLDADDDRAGFMLRWVETLAARLDQLDVICQETANPDLPDNVHVYSMGKEVGKGRATQSWRLTQYLRYLVPQADGVFCHMIPRYVLFAAPWTRLHGKPLFFWYTHRQISRELRAAHALATHILTAAPGSYPLPSGKVHVVGHGIETTLFPHAGREASPPAVIHVARLARIKGQDRLLRALSRVAGRGDVGPFRVQIVGGPVENEPDYPTQLDQLVRRLDPPPPATFTGPLARTALATVIEDSALAVNLSPPGLFDKAALESMLVGKPTLVMNTDFLPVLGDAADLLYLPHDAHDDALANRLATLLALSPAARARIGRDLRERVIEAHSLGSLMDRIANLMHRAVHA